jgi:type I restriction enzyme S subunit
MSSEWETQAVGDVALFENRLRIPLSAAQRAERPGPYPYWGANGPFDTVEDFLFDGARVLVAEDGNTVVRRDGRGTVHWATGRYWVNNHAHVLNVKDGNDLRWLFYALSHAHVRDFVTGSAQPKLSMGSLKRLPLRVPPCDEQRRIAAVLGTVDDKVESNRGLAAVATEVVGEMYRHRFAGRTETVPFSSYATLTKRQVQPSSEPDALFEHFSIPAFDAGALPELAPGSTMLSGKTALPEQQGVLFSKLNPATRRVWWPAPLGVGIAVCSPEFLVLIPEAPSVPASFLYAVCSFDERFYSAVLGNATGTTSSRQRIRPAEVLASLVPKLTEEELADWDAFARPLVERAVAAGSEGRILESIREALLPKLVSGAIRVSSDARSGDPQQRVA